MGVSGRKRPWLALLLSFLWPGLGQVYAGRPWLGLTMMAGHVLNFVLFFSVIGMITGPLLWFFAMAHAYQTAASYGRLRP